MPTEFLPEDADLPHRLGRHVNHDPASRGYRFVPRTTVLVSVRWFRAVPIFDQGQLGSCTGNAAVGWVATANVDRPGLAWFLGEPVDEALAVECYEKATEIDPFDGSYPPDDTGSDGLSVTKVLQGWNLVDHYSHGFSLADALAALQDGPVLWGTVWKRQMFFPAADGRITVSGSIDGGHEILLDEIDVERQRVWFTNSWGEGWGVNGRAYVSWTDLEALLELDGDVTVPHALVDAPVPPPPPPLPPEPEKPGCLPKSVARLLGRKR